MKKLLALTLFLSPLAALADEYPVDWFIKDHFPGVSKCVYLKQFQNAHKCGEKSAQLWACELNGQAQEFLVTGMIGSDVANGCSPTFMPEHVLKAK